VIIAFTRYEGLVPFLHVPGRRLAHQFAEVAEVLPRLQDMRREDGLLDDHLWLLLDALSRLERTAFARQGNRYACHALNLPVFHYSQGTD
jgi:hypothetical protein